MSVTGSTRLLCVVGDPIAQVRAPMIWNPLFRHNGINALCVPVQVPPASLRPFWDGIRTLANLVGVIVTIPHKPAALSFVDDASPRARQVGAVNALAISADGRIAGDIFDGIGFVDGLRASGQSINGRRALIVGSGGVGSAIAFAVAEAGVSEVSVADIDGARAESLSGRLRAAGYRSDIQVSDPNGYDLVVNATPLGMRPGDPLPFDPARLNAATIVADVVNNVDLTPLLIAARERGCFVQSGTIMTDHQIGRYARFYGFEDGDWGAETIARLVAYP